MKKLLLLLCFLVPFSTFAQLNPKKIFKFATFYAAINGGTSISDVNTYSISTGQLQQDILETPFDYNIAIGVRKIKRFGYENRANTFYNGTERSYSDAATLGLVDGFEFLFEADLQRQFGENYLNQNHFIRYVADNWVTKVEYNENGFVDIRYFEASQRLRKPIGEKLSINVGAVQRLSKPYGYDPLSEWVLDNGSLHYTFLALEEMGYSISVQNGEYYDPDGNVVATSPEVWDEVVIPQVLSDYANKKQNEIDRTIEYSAVIGFDYYHFTKDFWLHSWGNLMPYHVDTDNEFSYHKYNNGQWLDYSGGLIFGYRLNKHLGMFLEGKYNKYWNREWHDFSLGLNYVIF